MVYCRYCGEKNKDNALKCRKCRKPLSLAPIHNLKNLNNKKPNHAYKKDLNEDFTNDMGNFNQKSIRSRYNDFNRNDNGFNENKHRNPRLNKVNSLSTSQTNYHDEDNRKNLKKHNKNHVEWDVVVATALLVIILTTILQRFFPRFGLLLSLFIGLIYVLTATKSKITLFKAIPLAIVMVFTISTYFSL